MTLQVHAAVINKNTTIDTIRRATVLINGGGFVNKIGRGYIIQIEVHDDYWISIPIDTPPDYDLTDSNWSNFLFYAIQLIPNKKLVNDRPRITEYREITCRRYLNGKYFQIKVNESVYGILVTGENELSIGGGVVKSKKVDQAIVFHQDFDNHLTFDVVCYQDYLMVVPGWNQWSYQIPFKHIVSPQVMLITCIKGDHAIEIDPTSFAEPSESDKTIPHYLVLKNIGSFYYLESVDQKIRCSIAKNPALQAVCAIFSFIDTYPCSKDQRVQLTNRFASMITETRVDQHQANDILNACVAFKDTFCLLTGDFLP